MYESNDSNAIVGQKYIVSRPTTLILCENPKRKLMGPSLDDFSITDNSGRPWFKVNAKSWSMSQKRSLFDDQSRPLLVLSSNGFSRWEATDSHNRRRLYWAKPKIFTWKSRSLDIFLKDRSSEPAFKIRGSFWS